MATLKKQNINKSKKNVKSRNKFSKSRKSFLKSRKNMVGGMFGISKYKPSQIIHSQRPLPTIPGEKPTEVIKPNIFHRLAAKVGYNTEKTKGYYDNLNRYTKDKNLYDLKQLEESRRQYQMREQSEALESQKKTDEKNLLEEKNFIEEQKKLEEQELQKQTNNLLASNKHKNRNLIYELVRQEALKKTEDLAKKKASNLIEQYSKNNQIKQAEINETRQKRQAKLKAKGPNVSAITNIKYEPLSELELQQQKNNNDIKQKFAKEASNYALQSLSNTKFIPTGKELRPAFNISNLSKMSKPNYDEYIKQYDEYRKKYFDEKILEVNLFKKLTANGKDKIQPYLEDIIKIKDKNLDPTETEKEIKDLFININVKFPSYINKDLLELLPKAFASFSSEKIKEIVYKTNIKENIDRKFAMENLEF